MNLLENLLALKISIVLIGGFSAFLFLAVLKVNFNYINYQAMLCVAKTESVDFCESWWKQRMNIVLPRNLNNIQLANKKTKHFTKVFLKSQIALDYCKKLSLCSWSADRSAKIRHHYGRN